MAKVKITIIADYGPGAANLLNDPANAEKVINETAKIMVKGLRTLGAIVSTAEVLHKDATQEHTDNLLVF